MSLTITTQNGKSRIISNAVYTWVNNVTTRYTALINASSYANKPAMITELQGYMNAFSTNFSAYVINSSLETATINALIPAYSYVGSKYNIVINNSNCPVFLNAFPVEANGFLSLYSIYLYPLPDYNTVAYFTLDPSGPSNGIVNTTAGYTTDITNMFNATADIARITTFQNNTIPPMTRIIFQVFADNLSTYSSNIDVKAYLYNNLNLLQVLNDFGWSVVGINA
jgi:hypothetical protein